ncbi:MAG: glutamate-1-semialdehyde 2,1-aminomutase [Candidatus Omnitrophica bacterium]|nr:Glutamate-1-semialdehyde 2,1-aminomutase [bacterium]NUN96385.1 glutamate-1-semialdehyde 2,1-aminomutase [Candidatus Omnitrophota bacterium]
MKYSIRTSLDLYRASREVIPGGVNSPVRSFQSVGKSPIYISHAKGCQVFDVEGKAYIDYLGSWGPMILGHANNEVVQVLMEQVKLGTSYGLPTGAECELAEAVRELFPSVEMLRLVNSGTEATMTALRLARGATGRDRIIKFAGCYHGHVDSLLVEAGSGAATFGVPNSPGVPERLANLTEVARFNDLRSVERIFEEFPNEVAALIVEPVAGNMGVAPPAPGFLEGLKALCAENGALLIFDEVMTGFRVSRGGAQEKYGVKPDLTTLGKILGGGLPVGAVGGRRDLMEQLAPSGPIYQAGTLSGNPMATAAGLKTLQMLRVSGIYETLENLGAELETGLNERAAKAGVPCRINRVGSMLTAFFTDQEVVDFDTAKTSDTEAFGRFFGAMLNGGVLIPPSQFEAWFISGAHADMHIRKTLEAAERAFREV